MSDFWDGVWVTCAALITTALLYTIFLELSMAWLRRGVLSLSQVVGVSRTAYMLHRYLGQGVKEDWKDLTTNSMRDAALYRFLLDNVSQTPDGMVIYIETNSEQISKAPDQAIEAAYRASQRA